MHTKTIFTLNLRHDFKSSITVFFVALPLCLGVALASGTPVYSGLIAGIIGGLIVTLFSRSELSVSGPAAGLTAICAAAITDLRSLEIFFMSVTIGGILQAMLGLFRLGGFTYFIPSSVIKGMLSAIGIILISKQIPLLIGYDQPDFWRKQLFNIITFRHGFDHMENIYAQASAGAIIVSVIGAGVLILWKRTLAKKFTAVPASFLVVFAGVIAAIVLRNYFPSVALAETQFVNIPHTTALSFYAPDFSLLFSHAGIWQNAIVICFVASLESLLSLAAIDRLDPQNRVSPPNRELIAQGTGNIVSGLAGGLPITAVIVRSAANAEAGARTKMSAFLHGLWLLIAMLLAVPIINMIPYGVLAVILIRTGYNLAKPKMIRAIYRQGREQFLPFIVTTVAILFTDLLIGVLIGIGFAIYFLITHTYRAGYTMKQVDEGHTKHFYIRLALNVSFLNKKRITEMLDKLPEYSIVEIDATDSVYIDRDILEIFQEFRSKAHRKHIQLNMKNIMEVETIEVH